MITAIDNRVEKTQFRFLNERLSGRSIERVNELISDERITCFRARGHQEVIGYIGRQMFISLGGYWQDDKFHVDSFGAKDERWHTYSTKGGGWCAISMKHG